MEQFDYDSKTWGGGKVNTSPFYFGASQIEFTLDDIKEVKGRVLEVGCGAGRMAKAIKHYRPDLNVVGIDISKIAINQARKYSSSVKFLQGDAYKIPFKDNSFDAVIMFDLLEHLDNPNKSLSEIKRVLKKGGVFSAFIPIEGGAFSVYRLFNRLFHHSKEKYAGHIQQYTLSDLLELFKETGLKYTKKRYFGHVIYQLVDLIYFTYLAIRGKNVLYTVEGYLEKESGLKRDILSIIKYSLALACYYESKLLSFFPGLGVHLTARG